MRSSQQFCAVLTSLTAGEYPSRKHVRGAGIGEFVDIAFSRLLTRSQGIRHVLITEEVVRGTSPALYWSRGEAATFWNAWAAEEESRTHPRPAATSSGGGIP